MPRTPGRLARVVAVVVGDGRRVEPGNLVEVIVAAQLGCLRRADGRVGGLAPVAHAVQVAGPVRVRPAQNPGCSCSHHGRIIRPALAGSKLPCCARHPQAQATDYRPVATKRATIASPQIISRKSVWRARILSRQICKEQRRPSGRRSSLRLDMSKEDRNKVVTHRTKQATASTQTNRDEEQNKQYNIRVERN